MCGSDFWFAYIINKYIKQQRWVPLKNTKANTNFEPFFNTKKKKKKTFEPLTNDTMTAMGPKAQYKLEIWLDIGREVLIIFIFF